MNKVLNTQITCRNCDGTTNELFDIGGHSRCPYCDDSGNLLPVYVQYLKPYISFTKPRKQDLIEILNNICQLGFSCQYAEEFKDKVDALLRGEK